MRWPRGHTRPAIAPHRRRKAFALSFLSGLGEPLGAVLVFAVLGHAHEALIGLFAGMALRAARLVPLR